MNSKAKVQNVICSIGSNPTLVSWRNRCLDLLYCGNESWEERYLTSESYIGALRENMAWNA